MRRRTHDLSAGSLDALPDACRSCVFWEVAGARQGPGGPPGAAAKEAWWQATQLEWGTPGKGVWVDEKLVAYVLYGPGRHFPASRRLGPGISDDALLLATAWVDPQRRREGLATQLLQAVLREAHRYRLRAVEAYGWRRPAFCALPVDFLLAAGFSVVHEHPSHPLVRLDLSQTARESVTHALEGLLAALGRRERAPAPAPRAG